MIQSVAFAATKVTLGEIFTANKISPRIDYNKLAREKFNGRKIFPEH